MSGPKREDFASATMVRALLRGMSGLGLRLPEVGEKLTKAIVPLNLKRAVVQSAVEQAGLAALPLLGRGGIPPNL